jgi:hypothetical protein
MMHYPSPDFIVYASKRHYRMGILTLNQKSKFTVWCSRVLIEVLVVGYHTAWKAEQTFQNAFSKHFSRV